MSESEPKNTDTLPPAEENPVTETSAEDASAEVDEELEAMKARVKEMEEEAAKLRVMQSQVQKTMASPEEDKEAIDIRSVHVGKVDYGSSPEELQTHFQSCGTINRVTIICDKFTGHPKGFAYIEFADEEGAKQAVQLNESLFRGRLLTVTAKRTNIPGFAARGRGRGGFRGGGYRGHRGRGRGRGRGYYSPY